jgi:ketosteroid isomerase-like protein
VRAQPETLDWIKGYYALMDSGDLDGCDRYFAPDATLQIAHLPQIVGYEAIDRVMRAGMAHPMVRSIAHDVKAAWEEEDGVVIFEVVARYTMADGDEVDVPGVVIGEVSDGRFTSQRIAADLSPVYNRPGTA